MDLEKVFVNGRFLGLFRLLARNCLFTGEVVRYIEQRAYDTIVARDGQNRPLQVRQDKHDLLLALLGGFLRAHRARNLSSGVIDRIIASFVNNVLLAPRSFRENGARVDPPFMMAISPTQACNLRCAACSTPGEPGGESMEFALLDRLLTEKASLWHSHFTVITGGEPLLYKSRGRTILDAAARHPDQMFMVFTNGTLLDDEVAEKMALLGNVSPVISIDGFEMENDARRGRGAFAAAMKACASLRKAGVPFGAASTATRHNWELVTSRQFVERLLLNEGAICMWIFQYMPIGRSRSLDLMVPPPQRKAMMERAWEFVRRDGYFVADFWNCGTATNGCMAAARPGGYVHVNWRGDIEPCVFAPCVAGNINDIYARGENLSSALDLPFFKYVRRWQDAYGYSAHMDAPSNWLAPCLVRDHFKSFLASVKLSGATPSDAGTAAALSDRRYVEGMAAYGASYREETDGVWRSQYLKPQGARTPRLVQAGD